MLLPSCHFPSDDAAEVALHAWTLKRGFNVSRRRPMKLRATGDLGRDVRCGRGGAPKNTRKLKDEEGQRPSRGSKCIGCVMRIHIVAVNKNEPEGSWMIDIYDDGCLLHNHPPSEGSRIYVVHRQRSAASADTALERT